MALLRGTHAPPLAAAEDPRVQVRLPYFTGYLLRTTHYSERYRQALPLGPKGILEVIDASRLRFTFEPTRMLKSTLEWIAGKCGSDETAQALARREPAILFDIALAGAQVEWQGKLLPYGAYATIGDPGHVIEIFDGHTTWRIKLTLAPPFRAVVPVTQHAGHKRLVVLQNARTLRLQLASWMMIFPVPGQNLETLMEAARSVQVSTFK